MSASATASKPPAKRGRKPNSAKWLSLEDLAEIVRWKVADLERLLDRVPGTFPGAIQVNRDMTPDEKRGRLIELSRQRDSAAENGFKRLFPEQVRKRHY